MSLSCPECGCTITAVKDSRPSETRVHQLGTVRRRRLCESCDHRFTTYEIPAGVLDDILLPEDVLGVLQGLRKQADDLRKQADQMLWALGGGDSAAAGQDGDHENPCP